MSLSDRLGGRPNGASGGGLHDRLAALGDGGYDGQEAGRDVAPLFHPAVGRRRQRQVYDPLADVRRRAHQALLDLLGPRLYDTARGDDELERQVREVLPEVLANAEVPLSTGDRINATRQIIDEIVGHGPIEPLLRDPEITEVMVNAWDSIYVERYGQIFGVEATFMDEAHLRRVIDKIVSRVGRRVDESSPMVDARLPDGSRVNAVVPPISLDGAALTVRKFATEPYTVDDLIDFGTMTINVARLLEACVVGRLDVLISGGTGTGKTTLLNVLSQFVPQSERIITIEDSAELRLAQENVLRLEYRPPNMEGRGEITIRDLVRNALRMRPDRIVVGEVRGGEALDMLQAMNTGHDGSLSTVHANSPRDLLSRLETMALMAGVDIPVRAIREQLAAAVHLIVHQARLKDGSRRLTHVTEVVGMEGEVVSLQDLFLFDFRAGIDGAGRFRGGIRPTGLRPRCLERLADQGVRVGAELFQPDGDPLAGWRR
jgi:pilus assembly protein CpaF